LKENEETLYGALTEIDGVEKVEYDAMFGPYEHYGHENRNGTGIIKYCNRQFKERNE
jgi:hypothetical protein